MIMTIPKRVEQLKRIAEENGWNVHDAEVSGDSYVFCAERWISGEHELGVAVEFVLPVEPAGKTRRRRWCCVRREMYVNKTVDGHTETVVGPMLFSAISHIEHWLEHHDEAAKFDWVQKTLV